MLPDSNWKHKKSNYRDNTFAQKDFDKSATWLINNLDNLMIEIDKNLKEVLLLILNMQNMYTKYLK